MHLQNNLYSVAENIQEQTMGLYRGELLLYMNRWNKALSQAHVTLNEPLYNKYFSNPVLHHSAVNT